MMRCAREVASAGSRMGPCTMTNSSPPIRATVSQFDDTVGGFGRYGNLGAPVEVFLFGHRGKASRFETHVDDFGQRDTGTDAVARKIIHLDIAVVAYDQAMCWIEET